jgi:hypothetical protein
MPASLNGCGTTYYGSRDFHEDGSYITTEWIIFVYIPIFPLGSFRVLPVGKSQDLLVFHSQNFRSQQIPLCRQQVRNTYLTLLTVIFLIVLLFIFASVNGTAAFIYLVFLLSIFLFKRTYLSWYWNIVRMTRSRNQFNQRSAQQPVWDAREDIDLTLELELSLEEMCTGIQKQISIEGGTIYVQVPAGVSPGMRLRIRGKGSFERDTSRRGDLYLKIVTRTDPKHTRTSVL